MNIPKRTAGFTLIEMSISVVLLSIIIGGMALAVDRGRGVFRETTANHDLDSRSARTMNRILRELLGFRENSLNPNLASPNGGPVTWSSTLDFTIAAGWAGGVVPGTITRIALELENGELDNGVDDNSDGLVDERAVVLIQNVGLANEARTVLVGGVSELAEGEVFNGLDDNGNGLVDEAGLAFDIEGGSLNVRLSIERLGPSGDLIQRSQATSVVARN